MVFSTSKTPKHLVGYSYTDLVGNYDDRKGTSDGCFYVGNNLVSWYKQKEKLHLTLQQKQNILHLGAVVHSYYG